MGSELHMLLRLALALVAGGLIGFERGYHGHAAGFRTHARVCLSAAMLMLVTSFPDEWLPASLAARIQLDPTRIAQGIMTGIGFLGAGVIMKDGLSIRGLTTAASIWTTSALGVLIGLGFYVPAGMVFVFTLGALVAFTWIEAWLPTLYRGDLCIQFARPGLSQEALHALLAEQGFTGGDVDFRLLDGGERYEYRLSVQGRHPRRVRALTNALRHAPDVREFNLMSID